MNHQPRLEQRQSTTASPRLQHAVRLLQMSSLDYALTLRAELAQNPFLDFGEEDGDDPASEADDGAEPADAATEDDASIEAVDRELLFTDSGSSEPDGAPGEDVRTDADDRDSWADVGTSGAGGHDGDESGDFDRRAAEDSLAQHLHGQLGLLALEGRDRLLALAIIESLDDDGHLRIGLDELVDVTDLDPPASEEELRIALCRVQSLEPCGVGARSVVECLTLQAATIEDADQRRLAQAIIGHGLEALAKHDIAALAKAHGATKAEVEAAFTRIRALDPRPGWRHGRADLRYIAPDVVMRKVRGQWTAQLNDAVVPRLRLHCVYAEMFERQQRRGHPEMAQQLRDARWTLRNVEQRFATILGVAQAIVAHQAAFFEHGPLAMKPLSLREIANEVGVHESTVCRVTHDKYIATPAGVFELKYFFSRGMRATSGGEVTGTAIRAAMQRLLEDERAARPLSDAEIARALARQGVTVTRRTVTKYRHVMRIDSAQLRRRESSASA